MSRAAIHFGLMVLLAALAVLLAAGCGSGDEGDSASGASAEATQERPPGVSMSRPEFIAAASKACRRARQELAEEASRYIQLRSGEVPRPVLYADLAHQVLLPAIEAEMEGIRYLGVPPSELDPIEKILDDAEYTVNAVVFQKRIPSIEAVYREFNVVTKGFRSYGLPACTPGISVLGDRS